ncbi:MAG: zf-HC2 domain-containing protein [Acidimicrobiia bacterium]|nr:zf-HC2 domain-containing protein [Acidimicrobiia bacterium]
MNCSSFDLKAYSLGEAASAERREVETHLAGCADCRRETERLGLTRSALLTLREEEPPRRIGFVSDKVFEPRWYERFWQSGPRLGFASAALLSCAILVHAFVRTEAPVTPAGAGLSAAQVESIVDAELSKRLDTAVRQAVARTEAEQQKKAAELVAAAEQRLRLEHRAEMLSVQETFEVLRKRMNVLYVASAESRVAQ